MLSPSQTLPFATQKVTFGTSIGKVISPVLSTPSKKHVYPPTAKGQNKVHHPLTLPLFTADSLNKTLGIQQEYKVNATPTKGSIDGLIRKAAKQAEHIVLSVESDISLDKLSDALRV